MGNEIFKSFSLGPTVSQFHEEKFETKTDEAVQKHFAKEEEKIRKSTNLEVDAKDEEIKPLKKSKETTLDLHNAGILQAVYIQSQFRDKDDSCFS